MSTHYLIRATYDNHSYLDHCNLYVLAGTEQEAKDLCDRYNKLINTESECRNYQNYKRICEQLLKLGVPANAVDYEMNEESVFNYVAIPVIKQIKESN
jgi:hypothetical protein